MNPFAKTASGIGLRGRLGNRLGWLLAFGMLFGGGCAEPTAGPQQDEALKRALEEGASIETAAGYFNYYTVDHSQYEDSYRVQDSKQAVEPTEKKNEQAPSKKILVWDYFAGMDSVNRQTGSVRSPDQLFDALFQNENPDRQQSAVAPDLNDLEQVGRNTWMAWCGGNEGFWDWLATDSLGFIDLLKLVDSRQFDSRFRDAGVINEPGMEQAGEPPRGEFGLWIDVPSNPEIRTWREAYLRQSFQQIRDGLHKSQVGLKKKTRYGTEGPSLFNGKHKDAYRNVGYLYPSDYVQEKPIDSVLNHAMKGDGHAKENYYLRKEYSFLDRTVPPPDMYGISSGVVGLRLFPNPYFDAQAQKKWDAERYYNDPTYYNDPALIRPYRVGMACAFCHASFHPLQPPHDVNNPSWKNLSGNIGAQYLRPRATFGNQLKPDNFVYHLLDSQPPGTIDTSLIASDNINNPNTMNSVFMLRERAALSLFNPMERLSDSSSRQPSLYLDAGKTSGDIPPPALVDYANQRTFIDGDHSSPLTGKIVDSNSNPRHVPRILLDGADSIGTWGALARVFLNIGTYWEQWNEIHQVVVGFEPQSPFLLKDCETNSVYWNATQKRVPGLRDYFLKITPPMPLLSTPGGDQRLEPIPFEHLKKRVENENLDFAELFAQERALHIDATQLQQGRQVFAKNCIVCHSSIQPESMGMLVGEQAKSLRDRMLGADWVKARIANRFAAETSGEFWEHNSAQWFQNPDYEAWASEVVEIPEFWTANYLSNDYRVPVNFVGTNSGRAMATNGMSGHMWQDFASNDYKNLPSPGAISFFNPYLGEQGDWDKFMPRHIVQKESEDDPEPPSGGGGPGYYRVPTLVSIWATAPLLHNNSLGLFNNDPSVDGRLLAFDDAIRKLLWPEKRLESSSYNHANPARLKADQGLIWRTPTESHLTLDAKRVPHIAAQMGIGRMHEYGWLSWLKRVRPVWLPSLILFVGALVILLVSNHQQRRTVGYLVLGLAALLALAIFLGPRIYATLPAWLPSVYEAVLPLAVLIGLGAVLWARFRPSTTRWVGYGAIFTSLLLGFLVYYNTGKLGDVRIGPIPAGTPVNLLANFNSEANRKDQVQTVRTLIKGLAEIDSRHLEPADELVVLKQKIAPALMDVNKCPDFVMDRGHYFSWFESMTDDDKNALIELLKTF